MKLFPSPRSLFLRLSILNALIFLLPFVAGWHWLLDLGSNFQVQAVGVQLILMVLCGLYRMKKELLISSLLLIPGLFHLWPWVGFRFVPADAVGTADVMVKVTSFNVLHGGEGKELKTKKAKITSFLKETQSDIIFLTETDPAWVQTATQNLPFHSHQVPEVADPSCYSMILSKYPLLESEIIRVNDGVFPILRAVIEIQGVRITIIGVHPLPPMGSGSAERLRKYLAEVARLAESAKTSESAGGPVIVLGDLNVTPWSRRFTELIQRAELTSAAEGWNDLTTWNAFKKRGIPFTGLMIDHILHTRDLKTRSYTVTSDLHSDHFALTAELELK